LKNSNQSELLGSSTLFATRSHGFRACRMRSAIRASLGCNPALASTVRRRRSASAIASFT